MTARAKVQFLLVALAGFNVAVWAMNHELHHALDPILKALGS